MCVFCLDGAERELKVFVFVGLSVCLACASSNFLRLQKKGMYVTENPVVFAFYLLTHVRPVVDWLVGMYSVFFKEHIFVYISL